MSADINAGVIMNNTPASVTVTYSSNGFSPKNVTIKQGDTVTWASSAGSSMWVASAPHPAHDGYDGTSRAVHCAAGYQGAAPFDQCIPGSTYSFTFTKVGTWYYHDHNNSSQFGSVVVTQ